MTAKRKSKVKVKGMAGVYYYESEINKYQGKPDRTFWINFRDSDGKLKWEQCGKRSDGWNAQAAQQKRYETLRDIRVGDYIPRSQRDKDSITVDHLMTHHYLPWTTMNQRRPADDKSRYSTWIKEAIGNIPLNKVSQKDIEAIMQSMNKAGRADATINHIAKLVRHVFNKATEWQLWNGANPCQFIKLNKLNNARFKYLEKDEAEKLLKELHTVSPQIANIATISLYTGMRLGEIFNLKWKDINHNNKTITILDPKNNENRTTYITDPLERVLCTTKEEYPDDYVFKSTNGNKINFLSKTFPRVVEKLGLNHGIEDRRQKVTFHTFRHTYASWAVISGVSIYKLSKALGNKTSKTTERYAHLAPDSHRTVSEAVVTFANNQN